MHHHVNNNVPIDSQSLKNRPERYISLSVRHSPRLQVTELHLERSELTVS